MVLHLLLIIVGYYKYLNIQVKTRFDIFLIHSENMSNRVFTCHIKGYMVYNYIMSVNVKEFLLKYLCYTLIVYSIIPCNLYSYR